MKVFVIFLLLPISNHALLRNKNVKYVPMGYKESVCPQVPSKKPGGGFSVWMFLTSMALTTTIAANIANSANSNNNNNNDNNNEDNQNTNNYNVSTIFFVKSQLRKSVIVVWFVKLDKFQNAMNANSNMNMNMLAMAMGRSLMGQDQEVASSCIKSYICQKLMAKGENVTNVEDALEKIVR